MPTLRVLALPKPFWLLVIILLFVIGADAEQRVLYASPSALRNRATHTELPKYPPESVDAALEDTVVVQLKVSSAGAIEDLRVLEGHDRRIVESASAALRLWRFAPMRDADGQLLDASTEGRLIFVFRLDAGRPRVIDVAALELEALRRRLK